ncbi:MAG: tetratricopeptide repeat protein, partial [Gemmatimonadales bacterium]
MSRRALAVGVAVCLLASALNGCVYYNAMYNTKRLARSARKAERDGRTFEATNFWGQVATRAESVVVQHPRSKYVDEAMVLRGLALARLGQCPTAVTGLERVASLEPGTDVSEEAALALGRCRVELGDPATAEGDFARVAESRDDGRRAEA